MKDSQHVENMDAPCSQRLQHERQNECIMKTTNCNMPKILLQHQYTMIATSKKVVARIYLARARPRRWQELPRACDDGSRRQFPVTEAGDGMRDRRWRLGGGTLALKEKLGMGGAVARVRHWLGPWPPH
jgi:hypothetical protein